MIRRRTAQILLAAVSFYALVACDRSARPADKIALQPVPAVEKREHPAVLMVTWLVPGQPPQTTQTDFDTISKCYAARDAARAEGEAARARRRVENQMDAQEARNSMKESWERARAQGALAVSPGPEEERKLRGEPLPEVAAVCLEK